MTKTEDLMQQQNAELRSIAAALADVADQLKRLNRCIHIDFSGNGMLNASVHQLKK